MAQTIYTPSTPIPPVRSDISAIETSPGIVVLYDDMSYAGSSLRLPMSIVEYLARLDGTRSAEYLAGKARAAGRAFSVEEFLRVVTVLEQENFLDSPRFRTYRKERDREFNDLPTRPAAHAGASYPDDPGELRKFLDELLAADPRAAERTAPVAVIAPHIDFRVGGASYGPAYNALRKSDADTFIIFGVSHQMSYDAFMISARDFETPLGAVPADRELIAQFRRNLPFEITSDEIAHRQEHSIEFQAVFLRHIFPDRDIRIVPVLTGSLYEYVEMGSGEIEEDERLNTLYGTLRETARELGRRVCYIAGADLCHIGRKFGDGFAARNILSEVRRFDLELLARAAKPDPEGFINTLAESRNRYRVCGVAPIYATLRTAAPANGELLVYNQWDETERDSAVTFASVAYYA